MSTRLRRMEARKRPRRNWIQEERRKTLGDWVAFCVDCGFTLRYFVELEAEIPAACPGCTGEMQAPLPGRVGRGSPRRSWSSARSAARRCGRRSSSAAPIRKPGR